MADCLTPDQIEALVSGRLVPTGKARAEAHLAKCEKCRGQLDALQNDHQLLGDIKHAYLAETAVKDARPGTFQSSKPVSDSIEGYEILREIHRGGQGVVYKAVQKATKRTVALKVLLQGPYASARQRYRFEREIDLVAALQHPNIITVYDSGITKDERLFFAMEYVHGQPLDVYLSDKELSVDDTLRLFQQICAAVNFAHQRGVIHRDLKPGNILLDAEGKPHVLDFGMAKAAGASLTEGAPVTVTGEFMGTLAYASPEQTKGDPNLIDIRTDVYSLGVILYEMLTSKYPYEVVGQMADVLKNIAEAEPKKPSTIRRQINDEVETIVLKALAKEKERRYQSAEALAVDVEHYLNGEPIDAKRDSGMYILKKALARYRVPACLAASFFVMLAVGFIWISSLYHDRGTLLSQVKKERDTAREAQNAEAQQRRIADELREEAEQQRDRAEDNLDLAVAMTNLIEYGEVLSKAESTYREVYEKYKQKLGPEDSLTLSALNNFAATLAKLGKLAEAGTHFRETSEIRTRRLGAHHPHTLLSKYNWADVLLRQGEFNAAEELAAAVLTGRRETLGAEHRGTIDTMDLRARCLEAQKRLDEAEELFTDTVELARRILGNKDPRTLIIMGNLGYTLNLKGDYVAEVDLRREILYLQKDVLGEGHPETLRTMNNMAVALRHLRKFDEVERLNREVVEKAIAGSMGREHPDTLSFQRNYGSFLIYLQRYEEAEIPLLEAYETAAKMFTPQHRQGIRTASLLAKLYDAWEKPQQADEWRAKLPRTARATSAILRASELIKHDRHPEAVPLLRQCLEIRLEILPGDHWLIFNTQSILGEALVGGGKYDEAEPLLLDGFAGLTNREQEIPAQVREDRLHEARERIVNLYESWGKVEQAAEWRAKSSRIPAVPSDPTPP
ncbi:MAG: serine/threonine-protein kinase [Planctomycetota bacterium]|nr:serine/threonine-protein kinase [Planctomycetota bacterium]